MDGETAICMIKAQMLSIAFMVGENSYYLERFCPFWVDLYINKNFIWISS